MVERYDIPLSFSQSSIFLLSEHFSLILFLTTAWNHRFGLCILGITSGLYYHPTYSFQILNTTASIKPHFSPLPHLTSLSSETHKTNSGAHKPSKPTANLTPLPAPPRPRNRKIPPPLFTVHTPLGPAARRRVTDAMGSRQRQQLPQSDTPTPVSALGDDDRPCIPARLCLEPLGAAVIWMSKMAMRA